MSEIFVGRQPVYNQSLGVYGYELLFRAGLNNVAAFDQFNADSATSTTILNSFFEMGLDNVVGNRYAFINLTEKFLVNEEALPFAASNIVLEVLEDIPVTDTIVQAVKRLKQQGFTIALDDYIYNPAHRPLVEAADIIKIDIQQLSQKELAKHVRALKEYGKVLLAEKIETIDEFENCREQGFTLFQGYFLSRPRIVRSKSLPSNRLAVMNLLSTLHNADAEIEDIEEAITFDVSMSYKILKLINSAFFSFSRKIESIRHAIVILGIKQLKGWASMMAMSSMDDRPSEMIHMAMTRAKMCELLADAAKIPSGDAFFTVGLFSALDILMEREIIDLIKPLPLSEDIVGALLNREGVLGEALNCVLAYEVADLEHATFRDLSPQDVFIANVEAVSWANMVVDTL